MLPHDPPERHHLRVPVTRVAPVPDALRLARFRKAPEFGPRVLLFSGGSALNPVSRRLIEYTHNSIHIVTAFDSGGSSGKLRHVLDVPAVGDLRSRIMALADRTVRGQADTYELFAHRLPNDVPRTDLVAEVEAIASGAHPLIARITLPMRGLICNYLHSFLRRMPAEFDPRGASIGNLILAGGYLTNRQELSAVIFLFSRLVEARGEVMPSCGTALHLGAELRNGDCLIGQHLISAKEAPAIKSPIERLFLVRGLDKEAEYRPRAEPIVIDAIRRAELICFPMGSFYSSLIANLLPEGICDAIANNPCPKVYVPNTGTDPEQLGLSVDGCIRTLLRYLRAGLVDPRTHAARLTHLIVDENSAHYAAGLADDVGLHDSIEIVRARIVSSDSAPTVAANRLLEVLLSLA